MISMTIDRGLIRTVMDAGASGYLLKDDQKSIQDLGTIVLKIADGGIHLSPQAQTLLARSQTISDGESPTPRQVAVLSLCLAYPNDSSSDLAKKMDIANSTARNLLSGAYLKLDVSTRMAAVAIARQLGLITQGLPAYFGGFDN